MGKGYINVSIKKAGISVKAKSIYLARENAKSMGNRYGDYVRIAGANQLPMFIAVCHGQKELMDDWISTEDFERFRNICKRHGLLAEPDWIFQESDSIEKAIDSDRLCTTKFAGQPFKKGINGKVHVFISRNEKSLHKGLRYGWYPLVVGNRSIHKPYIDHVRFGEALGYPPCCIDFFRKNNNHFRSNNLYETMLNTKGNYSYLCNCLFMDYKYSLIHHIPCSFDCEKTSKKARALLDIIKNEDPSCAEEIEHYLKLPALVFQEKNIYVFEGVLDGNSIEYTKVFFVGNRQDDKYGKKISGGNTIKAEDDFVYIYNGNTLIHTVPKQRKDLGFFIQFS